MARVGPQPHREKISKNRQQEGVRFDDTCDSKMKQYLVVQVRLNKRR